MKILLAIDGSPASDRAIEMVATTTWPDGSRHPAGQCRRSPPCCVRGDARRSFVRPMAVEADLQLDRDHRAELLAGVAVPAQPGPAVQSKPRSLTGQAGQFDRPKPARGSPKQT